MQTVEKALDILEVFLKQEGEMGITAITLAQDCWNSAVLSSGG